MTFYFSSVESAAATATSYAACAPGNMANVFRAQYIVGIAPPNNGDTFVTTSEASAYDCCVSAIKDFYSAAWAFGQGQCQIYERPSCAPVDQSVQYAISPGGSLNSGLTVGNAYCGGFVPGV